MEPAFAPTVPSMPTALLVALLAPAMALTRPVATLRISALVTSATVPLVSTLPPAALNAW